MYFYFSSQFPAVIKVGGIYYGKLNDTVKHLNIDGDAPFIEVCPTASSGHSFNFFPDSEFLFSPPDKVSVTDLKGGYFIKFEKNFFNPAFKLIAQEKFHDALVTVFNENGLKISIETESSFFIDSIPFITDCASIKRFSIDSNDCVGIVLDGEEKLLEVFALFPKVRRIFSRPIFDATFNNGLNTEERFKDIAKHRVICSWELNDNSLTEKTRNVEKQKSVSPSILHEKIIPYAFLEEVLVSGNVEEFLCDDLKGQSKKLYGYLGSFLGVCPPPIFRRIDEVGLVYSDGERKYKVDYVTFEIKNNLIYNIKKADY